VTKTVGQLPEATSAAADDLLHLVTDADGLDKKIRTSNLASGGDVIWQWNGSDLSQFTDGATPEVDDGADGFLAVVTGRFNQPTLRVEAGTANGFSSWVIDPAPNFPSGPPSRYVLDMIIDQMGDGVGGFSPSSRVGFSHFCQYNGPGDVLAYSLCQYGNLNSYFQVWTRNTTFGSSGTTPAGRDAGTSDVRGVRHTVEVLQDVSGTFDMMTRSRFQESGSLLVNANNGSLQLDFDSGAFDGEVANTFGLAASWTSVGHFSDILMLRVLKHPADSE